MASGYLSVRTLFVGSRSLFVGLTSVALLLAQDPAQRDEGAKFKQDVRNVQAPVTVLDRDGRVVNGLNALDFKLYDNDVSQQIFEDLASHPISLVVAIQANSGTEKILPQIRKIASLFDNLVIGQDGEIAVIAFDHRVLTLTNFTSDPDMIHAEFSKDKLKSGSWTSALNDATMDGINMLMNRPKERKRIMIVISESRDQGSGLHERDVLEAAEIHQVVIYSLDVSHLLTSLTSTPTPSRPNNIPPGGQHLPGGAVMTPAIDQQLNNNGDWSTIIKDIFIAVKAIFVKDPLEVYSRYTGGREFPFYTQKGLEQAVDDIGRELHNQYLLTYSPTTKNVAGYHTIKVEVDKPGLKVFYREGYWIAAKQE